MTDDIKRTTHIVTDYWYCTEIQDHRLEGSETGSTLPLYVSDMVKNQVIDSGVRGLLFVVVEISGVLKRPGCTNNWGDPHARMAHLPAGYVT